MPQRVLVIDDNAEVRRLLGLMLRTAGYQVLEAESGLRGLQLMREQSPNLVLCDMVMPEVNGLGVLTAIQSDPFLSQIPVLMISATFPKIPGPLCVEPKRRRVSEQTGQPQRHQRRDGAFFSKQFMDRLARHTQSRCQRAGRETVVRHEILAQEFSWVGGRNVTRLSVCNAHGVLLNGNP